MNGKGEGRDLEGGGRGGGVEKVGGKDKELGGGGREGWRNGIDEREVEYELEGGEREEEEKGGER